MEWNGQRMIKKENMNIPGLHVSYKETLEL